MNENMWAIGFKESLPIEEADSLVEFTTDRPEPSGHDLLVKVSAVSVNPIDIAVRKGQSEPLQEPRVLGFDAVGTVVSKGKEVTFFENGDRVFYLYASVGQLRLYLILPMEDNIENTHDWK